MKLTGKITSISEAMKTTTVYVKLTDEKGVTWEKAYTYSVTEPVTVKDFQDRIKADLIEDLKPKNYVAALQAEMGKEFSITI